MQSIYPGNNRPYDILRLNFKQGKVFLVQKKRTRADIVSEIEPNIRAFIQSHYPYDGL